MLKDLVEKGTSCRVLWLVIPRWLRLWSLVQSALQNLSIGRHNEDAILVVEECFQVYQRRHNILRRTTVQFINEDALAWLDTQRH